MIIIIDKFWVLGMCHASHTPNHRGPSIILILEKNKIFLADSWIHHKIVVNEFLSSVEKVTDQAKPSHGTRMCMI